MKKIYTTKKELEALLEDNNNYGRLDEDITKLVVTMNKLPFVETYCSCSGHIEREDLGRLSGYLDFIVDGKIKIIELKNGALNLKYKLKQESKKLIELLKKTCKEANNKFPHIYSQLNFQNEILRSNHHSYRQKFCKDNRPWFSLRYYERLNKDHLQHYKLKKNAIGFDVCPATLNNLKVIELENFWELIDHKIKQKFSHYL